MPNYEASIHDEGLRGIKLDKNIYTENVYKIGNVYQGVVSAVSGFDTKIASIRIPDEVMTNHIVIAGTTGSGKSMVIHDIMDNILFNSYTSEGSCKAIITDSGGEFYSKRSTEKDILFNVYDKRSVKWNPFCEIEDIDQDIPLVIDSLIPVKGGNSQNEEWVNYARSMVGGIVKNMLKKGNTNPRFVAEILQRANSDEIAPYIANTPAQALLQPSNEKFLGSVIGVASEAIANWVYLDKDGTFSIRKYIENGNGNLYLTYTDIQPEAVRKMASAIVSMGIKYYMSLGVRKNERLYVILDELDSLGVVDSLIAANTRGRKYGLCVIAGIQASTQLKENYGPLKAQTLLSTFVNKVVLKQADVVEAEYWSKALGSMEVRRRKELINTSLSGFVNPNKDDIKPSEDITNVNLVTPSQLLSLPKRKGYVFLSNDDTIRQFVVPVRIYETITNFFVGNNDTTTSIFRKKQQFKILDIYSDNLNEISTFKDIIKYHDVYLNAFISNEEVSEKFIKNHIDNGKIKKLFKELYYFMYAAMKQFINKKININTLIYINKYILKSLYNVSKIKIQELFNERKKIIIAVSVIVTLLFLYFVTNDKGKYKNTVNKETKIYDNKNENKKLQENKIIQQHNNKENKKNNDNDGFGTIALPSSFKFFDTFKVQKVWADELPYWEQRHITKETKKIVSKKIKFQDIFIPVMKHESYEAIMQKLPPPKHFVPNGTRCHQSKNGFYTWDRKGGGEIGFVYTDNCNVSMFGKENVVQPIRYIYVKRQNGKNFWRVAVPYFAYTGVGVLNVSMCTSNKPRKEAWEFFVEMQKKYKNVPPLAFSYEASLHEVMGPHYVNEIMKYNNVIKKLIECKNYGY